MIALAVPLYSAGICNITVRRDTLVALGGFEPAFRAAFEDQVVLAKLYLHGTTYVLQAHLARYRRHPGSWTRQVKEHGGVDPARRAYHAWLVDYVDRCDVRDAVLEELLQPLRARAVARHRAARTDGLRRMALRILPRSLLRHALRWNRAREFREARTQYAGLCERLQPCRDVHAVAINRAVGLFDDVAHVDADTKEQAALVG